MKIKVELLVKDKLNELNELNDKLTPNNDAAQLEPNVSNLHVYDLFKKKMNEILKEH